MNVLTRPRCGPLLLLLLCLGITAGMAASTNLGLQVVPFAIHWPLLDMGAIASARMPPILKGKLEAQVQGAPEAGSVLAVRVVLTRPSEETNRLYWNKTLAFPQYDWMRYVRAWDKEQQWLWPNLPFLLRAHGMERVERYGGWDPGKEVDNDFAAVLIRKYDATGQQESVETRTRPLVSAEWYPVGSTNTDRQSIVHSARSDEFTVHLAEPDGRVVVWLIYADFMGAPVPRSFPPEPEFNGGILAFFQVDWHRQPNGGFEIQAVQQNPRTATGFNWRAWAGRGRVVETIRAIPRLTD